jgi:Ca2+-binding EF-hand superfamily protein
MINIKLAHSTPFSSSIAAKRSSRTHHDNNHKKSSNNSLNPSPRAATAAKPSIAKHKKKVHDKAVENKEVLAVDNPSSMTDSLLKEETAELSELFKFVDRDNGGTISSDEFLELLASMSVKPTTTEMNLIFHEMDYNKNNQIEFDEFFTFMTQYNIKSYQTPYLYKLFKQFRGCSNNGKDIKLDRIHYDDLIYLLTTYVPDKLKAHHTKTAQGLLAHINKDNLGYIDFKSYLRKATPFENFQQLEEMLQNELSAEEEKKQLNKLLSVQNTHTAEHIINHSETSSANHSRPSSAEEERRSDAQSAQLAVAVESAALHAAKDKLLRPL